MNDISSLNALLRTDLESFIAKTFSWISPTQVYQRNWHIQALARRLQQCLDGEIRRLIITVPPRNLKSISASVAFPMFALGQDPTRCVICASYSADLSGKLARDSRAVKGIKGDQRAIAKAFDLLIRFFGIDEQAEDNAPLRSIAYRSAFRRYRLRILSVRLRISEIPRASRCRRFASGRRVFAMP